MTSIRRQLLVSLLGALVIATAITMIVLYYSAKHEMYELYDENMQQIALAIGQQNNSNSPDELRAALKGEEEYLIQMWQGDILKYSSLPAIKFPLQQMQGHGSLEFNGKEWLFFTAKHGENIIQISQPRDGRFELVLEINSQLLLPILLQLPIMTLIVWLLVGKGLTPLSRISRLISQRNPAFLEKLPEENIPKEIYALVRALNTLLQQLEETLKIQSQFTGDAAHELRTPLTAVKIQLELLERAKGAKERKEATEHLSSGIDRSMRMVEQLLAMARQEPGTLKPFTRVDLTDLIADLLRQYQILAENKDINITFTKSSGMVINGDPESLSAMISNLINNALFYTQEGGRVEVALKKQSDKISLYVRDNGPGIPQSEYERVFDRFYRIKNVGSGSGLGLSIVKKSAEQHHAKIHISQGLDGKGISFQIEFSAS